MEGSLHLQDSSVPQRVCGSTVGFDKELNDPINKGGGSYCAVNGEATVISNWNWECVCVCRCVSGCISAQMCPCAN